MVRRSAVLRLVAALALLMLVAMPLSASCGCWRCNTTIDTAECNRVVCTALPSYFAHDCRGVCDCPPPPSWPSGCGCWCDADECYDV